MSHLCRMKAEGTADVEKQRKEAERLGQEMEELQRELADTDVNEGEHH